MGQPSTSAYHPSYWLVVDLKVQIFINNNANIFSYQIFSRCRHGFLARNTHSKQITHPVIYLVDQCVSSVPWTLIGIVFPYLLTNITTAINSIKHLAKAPLTPEFDISSLSRGYNRLTDWINNWTMSPQAFEW